MKTSTLVLAGGALALGAVLLMKSKGAPPTPTPPPPPPVEPYQVIDQLYQALHFSADANGYQTYQNFRTYFLGESALDQAGARQMLEEAMDYGWVDYTAYLKIFEMIYA